VEQLQPEEDWAKNRSELGFISGNVAKDDERFSSLRRGGYHGRCVEGGGALEKWSEGRLDRKRAECDRPLRSALRKKAVFNGRRLSWNRRFRRGGDEEKRKMFDFGGFANPRLLF
jgi:hypothetical protein